MMGGKISLFDGIKERPWFFYSVSALLLLWSLGTNPLWASEDRWAEIAREMALSGDWFHPAINGVVYFDKPLLSYWLILLGAGHFGGVNEFTVRLPGALAALAALWATRDLAKRLVSEHAAQYAGWILLSAYGFLFWGRTASAEMTNLAAVILAVDWFFACKERANFFDYLLFFLICFAGALTKGIPAIVLPPVLALAALIMDKSWKKHLKIAPFAAFIIGAALYFLTFYLAAKLPMPADYRIPRHGWSGLELVWRENFLRAFHPYDHNDEGFYAYLIHVPRIFLPWALLIAGALIAHYRAHAKLSFGERYLWVATAAIFLIFSASGSRRWYYILPIMPFLAIILGDYLAENYRWSGKLMSFYRALFRILAALAIPALIFALCTSLESFVPPAAYWAVPLTVLAIFYLTRQTETLHTLLAGTVIVGAVFSVIFPAAGARIRTEKKFALELKEHPQIRLNELVIYPECPGKIAFYLASPKPLKEAWNAEQLKKILANGDAPLYLVAENRRRHMEQLKKAFPQIEWEKPLLSEKYMPLEKRSAKKLSCWKLR